MEKENNKNKNVSIIEGIQQEASLRNVKEIEKQKELIKKKLLDISMPKNLREFSTGKLSNFLKRISIGEEWGKYYVGAIYVSILFKNIEENKTNRLSGLAKIIRNNAYSIFLEKSKIDETIEIIKPFFSDENKIQLVLRFLKKKNIGCIERDETQSIIGMEKRGLYVLKEEKIEEVYFMPIEMIKDYMDWSFNKVLYSSLKIIYNPLDKNVKKAQTRELYETSKKIDEKYFDSSRQ